MTFSCWALRIIIIGIISASASGKSLDLGGFVEGLATYRAVPVDWLWPLAWLVIGSNGRSRYGCSLAGVSELEPWLPRDSIWAMRSG